MGTNLTLPKFIPDDQVTLPSFIPDDQVERRTKPRESGVLDKLAQSGIIPDISKDYDPRITKGMTQVPGTERYQYEAEPFTVPKTMGARDPKKKVVSGRVQMPPLPTASSMEGVIRPQPFDPATMSTPTQPPLSRENLLLRHQHNINRGLEAEAQFAPIAAESQMWAEPVRMLGMFGGPLGGMYGETKAQQIEQAGGARQGYDPVSIGAEAAIPALVKAATLPINTLRRIAPRSPTGQDDLGAIVYHGTPHRWAPEEGYPLGRPKMEKVGTGEGAQAYGHGLYFAENPKVAHSYKNVGPTFQIDGKNVVPSMSQGGPMELAAAALTRFPNKDAALAWLGDFEFPVHGEKAKEIIRNAKTYGESKGHLYNLDIPDEHIAKMLDWDAPLSQQPENVKAVIPELLRQAAKSFPQANFALRDVMADDTVMTGRQLYEAYAGHRASPASASKALAELGIPGIKYLDQSSRAMHGGELIKVWEGPEGWFSKIRMNRADGEQFFTTSMGHNTKEEAEQWARNKIGSATRNIVLFDENLAAVKQVE